MSKHRRRVHALGIVVCLWAGAAAAQWTTSGTVSKIENDYADLMDAIGAINLLESGIDRHGFMTYDGQTVEQWRKKRDKTLERVQRSLARVHTKNLSAADVRAIEVMRRHVGDLSVDDSLAPTGSCTDAANKELGYEELTRALYACFDELGNKIDFEGRLRTRVNALDLLARLEEPDARKRLFDAFQPLWTAVNGANEPDSPYRRVIRMAAGRAARSGSAIDAAAKTVGATPAEIEQWLVQVLDTWRQVSDEEMVEPWDYRYVGGAVERELSLQMSRDQMMQINQQFLGDLGAEVKPWCTIYDIEPRPGKAPLAYTDFIYRGRVIDAKWRRTMTRVSGSYEEIRLGSLNEFVHENGHVVHMMALRARPAFMDLGDAVFYEAFADVPSWNTYEPQWQTKYLGKSASEAESLRGLFSNVMLDVAWALFEMRMLRDPSGDPNAVWTDITQTYLHVKPHPELAWWAVRVQLVDSPGYMVNYGLGAVLTADMRKHIDDRIGPFTVGNPRWFEWLSQNLLHTGEEKETAMLLREFLARPTSPAALLDELRRIGANKND
jgi:hypothetical protein